jgi:hypothetical protein
MAAISAFFVLLLFLAGGLGYILAYFLARFNFEVKLAKFKQEMGKGRPEEFGPGGGFPATVLSDTPGSIYDPAETRIIGNPVDFIFFPGLAKGEPQEIVFVAIKRGNNLPLTAPAVKIRRLIESGRVRWEQTGRPAQKPGG